MILFQITIISIEPIKSFKYLDYGLNIRCQVSINLQDLLEGMKLPHNIIFLT